MSEGSWIFLSHSHNDLVKVREVRNILEDQGHNPLMFFLKCLNDDDEIDDLITREIEARSWFILCDSINARNSRWVQEEVEIIKGYPEKTYQEIDMDDPETNLEEELSYLTKKASVFLSYTQADAEFAERIKADLREMDFGVFSNLEIPREEDWEQHIEEGFFDATRRGAVLVLLSVNSVQTPRQQKELKLVEKIIRSEGEVTNIIPLFIDDPRAIYEALPPDMRQIVDDVKESRDFSFESFEQNIENLMRGLREFDWRDRL